ncbi:acyl-CoA dehydrogenase family protein [Pseudonocardia sp. NPDC049154]|uniref:acyl-CoA dehydrogenase family protein n=1 Tax=Pseudonocardia sp. NPDC049154 TaxID=3155501 RepID=UPI0033ED701B
MSPTPAVFEAEATAFLAAHTRPRPGRTKGWGQGADRHGLIPDSDRDDPAALEAEREWRRTVFDAGFGWLSGPVELGGRGLPHEYEALYRRCEEDFDVPEGRHLSIGMGMVAPTVAAWGDEALRREVPRAIRRGDLVGCQLFSEPGAGSDLAALRTAARRTDTGWVVDGQKVWTSEAHWADVGLLLARTDPEAPKHAGITAFLVDMHAPGVDVRPLRQITGGASFNEVFLDGVEIPEARRLGPVNAGWQVARSTLTVERGSIGRGVGLEVVDSGLLDELVDRLGRGDDPRVRRLLAEIHVRRRALDATSRRLFAEGAGPEFAMTKLMATETLRRIADLLTEVIGPAFAADGGEWGTWSWVEWVFGIPGIRFGGGTDEIQRNLLAERVLGMPRT